MGCGSSTPVTTFSKPDENAHSKHLSEEHEERDEFEISLDPILIPEMNPNKHMENYTIDDVVNNNAVKGKNNWFLYGRKVYSLDLFLPIVFNRVGQYLELCNLQKVFSADEIISGKSGYLVYAVRSYGVRRNEMNAVLPACQIGMLINMSREKFLSRLKHCVDNVKTGLEAEEHLTENLVDYLEQLSRWLNSYPNVELEPPVDRTNVDLNQCEFPLPEKIRADSTVLRRWSKDWELFDTTVDEGAWHIMALLNEDWGDVHQLYAELVAGNRDENIPDFDMEIEGEAAWNVTELDIIKNDKTTEEQEQILKTREARKDLDNPERMRRRRKQIADSFLARHEKSNRLKAEDMIPYIDWASRLEQHWKEFQELCENYVHRQNVSQETEKVPDKAAF